MDQYSPTRSFWKEIKQRDRQLLALSMPVERSKIGAMAMRIVRSLWSCNEETSATRAMWEGHRNRFLGRVGVAKLYLPEDIRSNVSSEIGVLTRVYTYSTAFRRLSMGSYMLPDVESLSPAAEIPLGEMSHLEELYDATAITEEDCDQLVSHLRRGASGEFRLVPLEPAD